MLRTFVITIPVVLRKITRATCKLTCSIPKRLVCIWHILLQKIFASLVLHLHRSKIHNLHKKSCICGLVIPRLIRNYERRCLPLVSQLALAVRSQTLGFESRDWTVALLTIPTSVVNQNWGRAPYDTGLVSALSRQAPFGSTTELSLRAWR